jgi:hypothetical protein
MNDLLKSIEPAENPNIPESNQEKGMLFWYTTVRYGILDMKAKILWCDESIELLKLYCTDGKGVNVK